MNHHIQGVINKIISRLLIRSFGGQKTGAQIHAKCLKKNKKHKLSTKDLISSKFTLKKMRNKGIPREIKAREFVTID